MSADGANTDGATNKRFFCYQCNRTVTITISSSADPYCPICNEGFLEEYENPCLNPGSAFQIQNPNSNPLSDPFLSTSDPFSASLPLLFPSPSPSPSPSTTTTSSSSPASVDLHNPNIFGSTRSGRGDPFAFDPFTFIQNHLNDLRSRGAQIEFVAEIDPNRYGTPPASKSAVEALPTVMIEKNNLNSEFNQCAVCMDEFEEGTDAKQMPCNHLYHKDCILPWLEMHNTCPVCRHELPTDDSDYERRVRDAYSTASGNDGDSSGSDNGQRSGDNQAVERNYRISLPWPFGGRGSGSRSGDNAETRQEDLD
ncbi:E3 ubiquitin-protein ligase RING1 [Hibiscus syriacus]|uniref:RING-type E3 ubiquitin transferase n=1 Tax=Hibiscus syriacus TaxID=106335 RepID=A0A6A3CQU1_HIBSY|nr:E3 ubiquitin-protein ligase RING1 [Hibiscus syriacus]